MLNVHGDMINLPVDLVTILLPGKHACQIGFRIRVLEVSSAFLIEVGRSAIVNGKIQRAG